MRSTTIKKSPSTMRIIDRRGMSLVELMIALVLFSVILSVLFSFMLNSRRSYTATSNRVEYQQSIRAVFSLLTREVRSAGCDPQQVGFEHFAIADDIMLQYRADLDGNGDTVGLDPPEDVIYQYVTGDDVLARDPGTGSQTILRNVSDLVFTYLDADGIVLSPLPLSEDNRARIRYVDVTISGLAENGEPIEYNTRILIRNG